jgi:hypothetical protein
MRRHPTRAVLLVVAIAATFLAGCGSSSGSDAADATTTSAAGATTTEADGTTTEPDAATTTEAEAPTTTGPAGGDEICGPLKELSEKDAKANGLVAGGNWSAIKAFYVEQTDDIVAIYDEAIGYDSEITDDLETLRSVTVSAGDLAASSKDLMDFSAKLTAQPGLADSSAAALAANDFAQETCGFALAGF